jgi:hypothetical protein
MGNNNAVGCYAAITLDHTRIDDRDAFEFGIRGGLLIGHMISLGLGGRGFFNDAQYDAVSGRNIKLTGGYGGFFFEPIILPGNPVHVSFPILIGAGGIAVVDVSDNSIWTHDYSSEEADAFMVIEPGAEIELNVTHFFRFCVGLYYRYTTDVNIEQAIYDVKPDVLRGFSGGVTFKFGKF